MGVADGTVEEGIGVVKSLRLNVHEESDNWAILSEVRHFQAFVSYYFCFVSVIRDFELLEILWNGFVILLYIPFAFYIIHVGFNLDCNIN